jgi:NADH-quinone oxidoreductase subunit H
MVYADINLGILYLFAISSLGVYGVILSGWSSNTKYSFLGSLRSSAQMISYEIGMGFILLVVFIMVGSLNVTEIVLAQKGI